ncbi:MAG: FAD-binding protein [Actinobacteria bacterium]|nr:MAG: FAD-binding protein [Actinomycetota bacterium]
MKVTVAGAGMAGLVAAARLRELGHAVRVLEKGTRAGGSMLLSSCVVWRHLEWERFRAECPIGDERLQRLIWERLDEALGWLESLGAEPVWGDTENPLTTGRRYDPRALTRLLVEAAGGAELETPLAEDAEPPFVLATGGFAGRLARERGLLLRANPWSEGDGLDFAVARGAATTAGMDEFYGRAMPAPPARIREEDFVPLAQLYGRDARVFTDDWREITPLQVAWHENDHAQLIGPSAWYVVAATNDRIEAARAAGGTVLQRDEGIAVHVAAAVTHTIGGLQVDAQARVTGAEGLWVAGVDAGGVATGGYASGLAQALVLGLAAAESIAAG